MPVRLVSGIRPRFQGLSQSEGQVTHVLLTRSPLIPPASWGSPFDLHVLSTPPAFVLSQNQTLRECSSATHQPEDQQATDTTKNPLERGHQLASSPNQTHGGGPDPNSTPSTWHRLLGTLLSSQGTDAHPAHPVGFCSEATVQTYPIACSLSTSACRCHRPVAEVVRPGADSSWPHPVGFGAWKTLPDRQSLSIHPASVVTGHRGAGTRCDPGCLPGGPTTESCSVSVPPCRAAWRKLRTLAPGCKSAPEMPSDLGFRGPTSDRGR